MLVALAGDYELRQAQHPVGVTPAMRRGQGRELLPAQVHRGFPSQAAGGGSGREGVEEMARPAAASMSITLSAGRPASSMF